MGTPKAIDLSLYIELKNLILLKFYRLIPLLLPPPTSLISTIGPMGSIGPIGLGYPIASRLAIYYYKVFITIAFTKAIITA